MKVHYSNLASKIIQKSNGNIIRVYAHSLGSLEVLEFMKALVAQPDLPHKALEIFFISPPGLGQNGWRGLSQISFRFGKLLKNLGQHDQFHLYPLDTGKGEQDELNFNKRQLFFEDLLPRILPDLKKREQVEKCLKSIDAEILFLKDYPELREEYEEWFLHKRHKIMKGLLNQIFSGTHIEEEKHNQYLNQYSELQADNASWQMYLTCLLTFLIRAFKTVYHGLDARIIETSEYCQKQGVETRLGVVTLGKDELVHVQDLEKLLRLSAARDIPIFQHNFMNEEHASVAHKWELIDALEQLPSE